LGADAVRAQGLGIDRQRIEGLDPEELWKLWVLANLYQRIPEKRTEGIFGSLMSDQAAVFLFSPRTIAEEASASNIATRVLLHVMPVFSGRLEMTSS